MKNIFLSSSRQWNPGDEFIRLGIKNLLSHILGKNHNWHLWNRNPDLLVDRRENPQFRSHLLSNCLTEPHLKLMDYVVFAGTPEWTGKIMYPVFEELLSYPDKPVLILGVGSGSPNIRLNDTEKKVLRRQKTLITTRSRDLANEINNILGIQKAIPLPCPSLFCAKSNLIRTKSKIGIVLQSSSIECQKIEEALVVDILRYRKSDMDIICFYTDEFFRFSNLGNVRYSYEYHDYFQILQEYGLIISTRLHGAMAAFSLGIPSKLVAQDNYRIQSTCELLKNHIQIYSPQMAIEKSIELLADKKRYHDHITEMNIFVSETFVQYCTLIRDFLQ